MDFFKNGFVRVAQALAAQTSQEDVTVGEIMKKVQDKSGFLKLIISKFRRKK